MLIKVKAVPSAKKEIIIEKKKDSFEIRIKEKPVEGKASKKIIEILADYFNVEKGKIKIIKGFKERNKIFEIPDKK